MVFHSTNIVFQMLANLSRYQCDIHYMITNVFCALLTIGQNLNSGLGPLAKNRYL